jgi:hypothetical protein
MMWVSQLDRYPTLAFVEDGVHMQHAGLKTRRMRMLLHYYVIVHRYYVVGRSGCRSSCTGSAVCSFLGDVHMQKVIAHPAHGSTSGAKSAPRQKPTIGARQRVPPPRLLRHLSC